MRLLILLMLFTNYCFADVFYQKCIMKDGKTQCFKIQEIEYNKYKLLNLNDIHVNQCYKKDTGSKIVFFRIKKKANTMIWAFAQSVSKTNVKDYGDKIYLDHYIWAGNNFNEELQEFPCEQTPSLGDISWIKKNCNYFDNMNKATLYCNPIKQRRTSTFGERTF